MPDPDYRPIIRALGGVLLIAGLLLALDLVHGGF